MSQDRIQKVAVFGASGTLGTPITAALISAGFDVTIITRPDSISSPSNTFPTSVPVKRTEYTLPALTAALLGQHAVVSVVGVAGISTQKDMIDAAAAAGVRRFVVSEFGYGPEHDHLPEFEAVGRPRREVLAYAREVAARSAGGGREFTWSAVAIGNPLDWALKKFPTLGFDIPNCTATIYDSGTERFTGTTMAGIGAAVVGVLKHPAQTANRHLLVRSIETCQNELLEAFEEVSGQTWPVVHERSEELLRRGREKLAGGDKGWVLDLIVAQLLEEGKGRGVVVGREGKDNASGLLGVEEEDVMDMVRGIVAS